MEETYQLPSAERQERLLAALARLIQLRGYETFVLAPTLEPSSAYFPDVWSPTVRGVRTLIRRLMSYAELDAIPVDLEIFDSQDPAVHLNDDDEEHGFHEQNVAAWYAGAHEGRLRFGLDVHRTRDPVELTGVLAHEVAHAYRDHHGLMARDREIEEQLTDLTTIYLGFGVFSVSAAFVSRSSGGLDGAMVRTEYSVGTTGYLAAGELAFLLAARAVARADDPATVRALGGLLPANQAHAFRLSIKQLRSDPVGLREQLGIPAPDQWPVRARLEAPDTLEIEPCSTDELELSLEEHEAPPDASRPTFRVVRTQSALYGFGAATLGLLSGAAAFGTANVGLPLVLAAIAGGLGFAVGRTRRSYRCAHPDCGAEIERNDATCQGCERGIAGEIRHADERLAAEEAYERGDSELARASERD